MHKHTPKFEEPALLREAHKLIKEGVSAATFSAHFFGPKGRFAAACRSKEDREAATQTAVFRQIQNMASKLRVREARAFDQETEQLSGRVTIQVPRSLHAALKQEAVLEHVSLSELMRLKLGVPYKASLRLQQPNLLKH